MERCFAGFATRPRLCAVVTNAPRANAEAMEQRIKLQQGFVDERQRLERERETKIERIRAQGRKT